MVRLVENRGEKSSGTLRFAQAVNVAETNLLEWEEKEVAENVSLLPVELDPFEIRTLKLRTRG